MYSHKTRNQIFSKTTHHPSVSLSFRFLSHPIQMKRPPPPPPHALSFFFPFSFYLSFLFLCCSFIPTLIFHPLKPSIPGLLSSCLFFCLLPLLFQSLSVCLSLSDCLLLSSLSSLCCSPCLDLPFPSLLPYYIYKLSFCIFIYLPTYILLSLALTLSLYSPLSLSLSLSPSSLSPSSLSLPPLSLSLSAPYLTAFQLLSLLKPISWQSLHSLGSALEIYPVTLGPTHPIMVVVNTSQPNHGHWLTVPDQRVFEADLHNPSTQSAVMCSQFEVQIRSLALPLTSPGSTRLEEAWSNCLCVQTFRVEVLKGEQSYRLYKNVQQRNSTAVPWYASVFVES